MIRLRPHTSSNRSTERPYSLQTITSLMQAPWPSLLKRSCTPLLWVRTVRHSAYHRLVCFPLQPLSSSIVRQRQNARMRLPQAPKLLYSLFPPTESTSSELVDPKHHRIANHYTFSCKIFPGTIYHFLPSPGNAGQLARSEVSHSI